MDDSLDLTRWSEKPQGVGYRRWVIASTGLRQLFRMRFFKLLLILAWTLGFAIAAAGLGFSQSLASGGWLESLAANFGPRPEAVVAAFCAVVLLYPDVIVHGLFTALFWVQSQIGLGLCMIALTILVPRLVARDRATNALTIYLSRPLTSLDYLLGKFGIIVGILVIFWTGPLLFAWLLSMLFAPDQVFFTYSLLPLGRALLFSGVALVTLAAIAFGISAAAKTGRSATLLWIGAWILVGMLANFPFSPDWIRFASFSFDLREIRQAIFQVDDALMRAVSTLPMLNAETSNELESASVFMTAQDLRGAIAGLMVLVTLSSTLFFRRLRAE